MMNLGNLAAQPEPEDAAARQSQDVDRSKGEQRVERQVAAARAAKANADSVRLARARVDAVAKLRQTEAQTASVAAHIDDLAQQRRSDERTLKKHTQAIQPLLPLIERLSLYPAETLMAVPVAPDDALRGVTVLRGLGIRLEKEADALRRDQALVEAATAALRQEVALLTEVQASQKRREDALDQQIAASHAAQTGAEAEPSEAVRRAEVAASKADSLRSAVAALEAVRRVGELRAKEDAARGDKQKRVDDVQSAREREADIARPTGEGTFVSGPSPRELLQSPVTGVIIKSWGEPTDGGPAMGISYQAPPGARVICPCSGRIVFAEAFRSYGLLLITDCGGGYHFVLSGFASLDVKLGQKVLWGEPVGVMPSWEPGSTSARPFLYVELRHNGQPINPTPWLRSNG